MVDKLVTGEYKGVTLSIPPGHAKTTTITHPFPVYAGLRWPSETAVFTGYSQDFAERNLSRPSREIAENLGVLDLDSNAMKEWRLTNGARMIARGVGAAPTGINPIGTLVTDDPINSRAQAESKTERDNIWDWWQGSIVQRFWPSTRRLVIATRWHYDDLIGRIKESGDPNWVHINLPAIAEVNDPLGRNIGEALWPEVKPIEFLEEQRKAMGDYNFQALFQGNPTPREGAMFKVSRFEFIDASDLPQMVAKVRRWDVASSKGKGDYTAGVLMGVDADGRFYILDVVRGQWATDERNRVMRQTAEMDGTGVRVIVPEDPGAAGKDAALAFTRLFAGFSVATERETGDKTVRADPLSAQVNAGNVTLVRAEWNPVLIEEYRQFPNGTHDDQVDAGAGAFNHVSKTNSVYDSFFGLIG